jgi:hypothetical protein
MGSSIGSNRELVTLALSLLMAGYETTVDQLSLCILSVLASAELRAMLRADFSLIPTAVEEIMRISPAASVSFPRVATEQMNITDQTVEHGQPVAVSFIASVPRGPARPYPARFRAAGLARPFPFSRAGRRPCGAQVEKRILVERPAPTACHLVTGQDQKQTWPPVSPISCARRSSAGEGPHCTGFAGNDGPSHSFCQSEPAHGGKFTSTA